MRRHALTVWSLGVFLLWPMLAMSGPVKIHLQGTLTDSAGNRTFDGAYPVTVRLWNGGNSPILTVDTVSIRVVKGRFLTHIGPYTELTRNAFSTRKSLSFQFPGESELAPRTPLRRIAASGETYCDEIRLTTSGMPAIDAGSRVRLRTAERSHTGALLSMTPQSVEMLDLGSPGMVNRFVFDSLRSFEVSVRYRRHGEVGFIAGLALGAIAGYAMGSGETDDLSMSKETKRALDAFAGAILGGLTGYLMGNSITTDRWQSLPLERLRWRAGDDMSTATADRR